MTLSQLSDLSQIIGAFAVVFSLLYLSRQIRQNTHAVRMANATTLQTEFRGLARTLYSDTNTAAVVLAGMSGVPVGSPAGQWAAHEWFFDLLKMAELGHFHSGMATSIPASGTPPCASTGPGSTRRAFERTGRCLAANHWV